MFYVAYFNQGYPCETPSDPQRFTSVKSVTGAFRQYAEDTGRDYYDPYGTAYATVYACDGEEIWEEAERFAGVGCPFDYPSFALSIGKRGGIVRESC